MRPCVASQASTWAGSSRKSASAAASAEQSITQAGAISSCAGMVSVAPSRQLAAGDPVHRRVEVRAGVLAAGDVVPVPGRAALVVARDLLDPERLRRGERRRQLDHRRRRPQRSGSGRRPGCRRRRAPRRSRPEAPAGHACLPRAGSPGMHGPSAALQADAGGRPAVRQDAPESGGEHRRWPRSTCPPRPRPRPCWPRCALRGDRLPAGQCRHRLRAADRGPGAGAAKPGLRDARRRSIVTHEIGRDRHGARLLARHRPAAGGHGPRQCRPRQRADGRDQRRPRQRARCCCSPAARPIGEGGRTGCARPADPLGPGDARPGRACCANW